MSYTKTGWNDETKPAITASKLNNMENGIYSAHEQINTLVLGAGDSSAECAQARVPAEGSAYASLKQRLDSEYAKLGGDIGQLSSEIANHEQNIVDMAISNNAFDYAINIIKNSKLSNGVLLPSDASHLLVVKIVEQSSMSIISDVMPTYYSLYTGYPDFVNASNFLTRTEAFPTKYSEAKYVVMQFATIPTYVYVKTNNQYITDEVKPYLYKFNYTNDEKTNSLIKELYIPSDVLLYSSITRIAIFKSANSSGYWWNGLRLYTANGYKDYMNRYSNQIEAEKEIEKGLLNGVISVNGIYYIINWDNIENGTVYLTDIVVSDYVNNLSYSPVINKYFYDKNTDFENNLANPLLQSIEHNTLSMERIDVFTEQDRLGVQLRMPTCIVTNNGSVLVVATDRLTGVTDYDTSIIKYARYDNKGAKTHNYTLFESDNEVYGNVSFVVDRTGVHGVNGRIFAFAYRYANTGDANTQEADTVDCVYKYSDDDGITWGNEVSIKNKWNLSLYRHGGNAPSNGIQMSNGTLAIPAMYISKDADYAWRSGILYKKVGGDWTFSKPTYVKLDNECTLYEQSNGELILNCRTNDLNARHIYSYSIEEDWFTPIHSSFKPMVHCEMSIISTVINGLTIYLMSFPDSSNANNDTDRKRDRITIWASLDGLKWIRVYRVDTVGTLGYSNLAEYNGKRIVAYERNGEKICIQDVTNLNDLIYESVRTQLNRSVEYRLQEIIDKLLG